jgi:uncharacterized Zn-finger protein
MYSDVTPTKTFALTHVTSTSVACDGGGGALGHPRIFLNINPDIGKIACPYCSHEFKLSGNNQTHH